MKIECFTTKTGKVIERCNDCNTFVAHINTVRRKPEIRKHVDEMIDSHKKKLKLFLLLRDNPSLNSTELRRLYITETLQINFKV